MASENSYQSWQPAPAQFAYQPQHAPRSTGQYGQQQGQGTTPATGRSSFRDDAGSGSGRPSHGSYVQTNSASAAPPKPAGGLSAVQVKMFSKRAVNLVTNIKDHLSTGGAVTGNAWGRVTAGTQVLTKGGFDAMFKSTFSVDADEFLKKTYACFLSTDKAPVAGTLYISTKKLAFCSDRPLAYTTDRGQESMSYYRVVIPVQKVKGVEPSTNAEGPGEKYILVTTEDDVEFRFMGFVNYDKGVTNLQALLTSGNRPPTYTSYQRPPTPPYDSVGSFHESTFSPNQNTGPSFQQVYPPNQSTTGSFGQSFPSHQPPYPPYQYSNFGQPRDGSFPPNQYGTG